MTPELRVNFLHTWEEFKTKLITTLTKLKANWPAKEQVSDQFKRIGLLFDAKVENYDELLGLLRGKRKELSQQADQVEELSGKLTSRMLTLPKDKIIMAESVLKGLENRVAVNAPGRYAISIQDQFNRFYKLWEKDGQAIKEWEKEIKDLETKHAQQLQKINLLFADPTKTEETVDFERLYSHLVNIQQKLNQPHQETSTQTEPEETIPPSPKQRRRKPKNKKPD